MQQCTVHDYAASFTSAGTNVSRRKQNEQGVRDDRRHERRLGSSPDHGGEDGEEENVTNQLKNRVALNAIKGKENALDTEVNRVNPREEQATK